MRSLIIVIIVIIICLGNVLLNVPKSFRVHHERGVEGVKIIREVHHLTQWLQPLKAWIYFLPFPPPNCVFVDFGTPRWICVCVDVLHKHLGTFSLTISHPKASECCPIGQWIGWIHWRWRWSCHWFDCCWWAVMALWGCRPEISCSCTVMAKSMLKMRTWTIPKVALAWFPWFGLNNW